MEREALQFYPKRDLRREEGGDNRFPALEDQHPIVVVVRSVV